MFHLLYTRIFQRFVKSFHGKLTLSNQHLAYTKVKTYMSVCDLSNCNYFELFNDCMCVLLFLDFQHKITVQASPSMDKRRSLHCTSSSPPSSPTLIPRLRAIQRKFCLFLCLRAADASSSFP